MGVEYSVPDLRPRTCSRKLCLNPRPSPTRNPKTRLKSRSIAVGCWKAPELSDIQLLYLVFRDASPVSGTRTISRPAQTPIFFAFAITVCYLARLVAPRGTTSASCFWRASHNCSDPTQGGLNGILC